MMKPRFASVAMFLVASGVLASCANISYAAPRTSFQGSTAPQPQSSEVSIAAAPGVSLSLAASRSSFANNDPLRGLGFQATQEVPADMRFAARAGAFSFQAWRGQGGVSPAPSLAASHDGFASLARADHAVHPGREVQQLAGGVRLRRLEVITLRS